MSPAASLSRSMHERGILKKLCCGLFASLCKPDLQGWQWPTLDTEDIFYAGQHSNTRTTMEFGPTCRKCKSHPAAQVCQLVTVKWLEILQLLSLDLGAD